MGQRKVRRMDLRRSHRETLLLRADAPTPAKFVGFGGTAHKMSAGEWHEITGTWRRAKTIWAFLDTLRSQKVEVPPKTKQHH